MRLRDHRIACDCRLNASCADGTRAVTLRNVSAGGARVEGLSGLYLGSRIGLTIGPLRVWGRIAWMRHPLAGLRFDRPLPPDVIARLQGPASGAMLRRNRLDYHAFRQL